SKLVAGSGVSREFQPIRLAAGGMVVATLMTGAVSFAVSLTGAQERDVERDVITYLAYAGVALLAADGVGSRRRLDQLLRRLVCAGAALAMLGLAQFLVDFSPFTHLHLPGFVQSQSILTPGFGVRGVFHRAFGT